jgi:hypothetical protein
LVWVFKGKKVLVGGLEVFLGCFSQDRFLSALFSVTNGFSVFSNISCCVIAVKALLSRFLWGK